VSELALKHLYSGKVRDLYEVDDEHLVMVASDRLSAYDVIMAEPIPNKGRVLTGLTSYWTQRFADVPSALVSCDPQVIGHVAPDFAQHEAFFGRAMLVRRAAMVPLECVVRARLAGQAFDEYVQCGTVHNMPAPAGLRLTDPFPEPIFTPSTKADVGHDLNIDLAQAADIVGAAQLEEMMSLCLAVFRRAAAACAEVGLILADTKFELGIVDGTLVVCDEMLTPDSSRIWPADEVHSGETPPAFDKQPFREWLNGIGWDRTPPPPSIPEDIVALTSARYVAAYERITGQSLDDWYGKEQ
jgi:phosphoribosylaminoimidazole-succinocarboxamide synthase